MDPSFSQTISSTSSLLHIVPVDVNLQRLLYEVPLAIVILDNQGLVIYCNQAASNIFPSIRDKVAWVDIIEHDVNIRECTYKAIATHNGRFLTLKTSPAELGKYQVMILTDITEEERLHAQLEHQARLSDMGKMAGSLAHQIRTPLASVMLYVKNLLSAKQNQVHLTLEKEKQFLEKTVHMLHTMETKIRDMLIFAKSQQISKLDCRVDDLLMQLRIATETKNEIPIQYEIDDLDLNKGLYCNKVLLVDAILNCIENSINAEASLISIVIKTYKNQFKISIIDDGNGIDENIQSRVIEPFFTTKINGTGLGLSVVKMITEAHAGSMWIESGKNIGTKIHIEFPFVGEQHAANAAHFIG
jgi:two-component system, sensor histidine kinase FlrB